MFSDTSLPTRCLTDIGSERTIPAASYSALPRVTHRAPRDSHQPHQYLVDKVPTRTTMIYYMYDYVHVGVVRVFWNKVYLRVLKVQ